MAGRTYRYATAVPRYPFGFGLSYTQFVFSDLTLSASSLKTGDTVTGQFTLTNAGAVEAEEVAQLYITDVQTSVPAPLCTLVHFERVSLKPGEHRVVPFTITPEMMQIIGDDGAPMIEAGEFRVTIGGCSPSERGIALGAPQPVSARFEIGD